MFHTKNTTKQQTDQKKIQARNEATKARDTLVRKYLVLVDFSQSFLASPETTLQQPSSIARVACRVCFFSCPAMEMFVSVSTQRVCFVETRRRTLPAMSTQ